MTLVCFINGQKPLISYLKSLLNKGRVTSVALTVMSVMSLISLSFSPSLLANEVSILAADLKHQGNNTWSLNVTLKHEDTGWDHYADQWRLVDKNGKVLGDRILYHPHVNEQPFTRSLNAIQIPFEYIDTGETLYIQAHDKLHGWSENPLALDLNLIKAGRLQQKAP
ncbi:hypothetical protein [Marinomonas sp. MED121]|uniref:hypothetical protein n=1 Tax=Marinomonas sp. MED121 TaxID=314277 RepID=UPI001A94AA5E|nr:hypothetical protein [Marinomonas sp. MED121]